MARIVQLRSLVNGFLRCMFADTAPGLGHRLLRVVFFPIAVLIVLVVRLLRPVYLVRFGCVDASRIGPLALDPHLYLWQKEIGLQPKNAFDLWFLSRPWSNQQLATMWQGVLRLWPLVDALYWANEALPGGQENRIMIISWENYPRARCEALESKRDHVASVDVGEPTCIRFSPDEERYGRAELHRIGVPAGAPFVCFHNRDGAYLEQSLQPPQEGGWAYHDYRDCSIDNFFPAMSLMASRGYVALRMGAVVTSPLPRCEDPRIIDYAAKHRTDFLDIYLCAKSLFFIGNTAGLIFVPIVFQRPVVLTNFIPLCWNRTGPENIIIPKLLRLRGERRLLTFAEMLLGPVAGYYRSEDYTAAGIDVIENTADEIAAAVQEMADRLAGRYHDLPGDTERQKRFQELFNRNASGYMMTSRIGADFLRRYAYLLE